MIARLSLTIARNSGTLHIYANSALAPLKKGQAQDNRSDHMPCLMISGTFGELLHGFS